jgi:hypothetical protein
MTATDKTAADPTATPRFTNRLAQQSSPYLLQHAHNPVDWYPWGEEAFAEARRRDVPLFVSIGYSTCYWCHVMERECFENETLAAQLNQHFVCVKVDREERPDLDDLCMNALLLIRGQGGWPLNILLEPEALRPFWAGTYLPPEPRHGVPSLPQVIDGISHAWTTQRDSVLQQAAQIAATLAERMAQPPKPKPLGARHVTDAVSLLLRTLDQTHGGFGGAPKFPQPCFLELLLDVRDAADDNTRTTIDHALRLTLDNMMLGGMWDHLAGGFHRYSVDAQWLVPHFEKMLYDNALLAPVYARAARVLGDDAYADVAQRTCAYVLCEMRDARGLFCSAQDAEVDAKEGLSYLWMVDDVRAAVPDAKDAEFAIELFGLAAGPNFQDPHHPHEPPRNVLFLAQRVANDTARLAQVEKVRQRMLSARNARKQPGRDDKAITAWNGLMIGALAQVGALLGDRELIDAARSAADALLAAHVTPDHQVIRSTRGTAQGPLGVLEDYAMLAWGLVQVGNASGEGAYIVRAEAIVTAATKQFRGNDGGFFDTREGQADLFLRARSTHDGAMPSGQSVLLHALLDLQARTGSAEHLESAAALLRSLSGVIDDSSIGVANATRALFRILRKREWRDAAAATLETAGAASTPANADFTPVEVYASVERLVLTQDEPAEMHLLVRIADGYHIVAADSGNADMPLVPLRVHRISGEGFNVFADYPEGEPFRASPAVGEVRVMRGDVEMRVALERDGEWKGTPLVAVTFQACRDDACLKPQTVELDVAIDRA